MSRNSCDECGGLAGAHTADCPNRADDRAVVVAEALAAHGTDRLTRDGDRVQVRCSGCSEVVGDYATGGELASDSHAAMQRLRAHQAAAILAALDGAPA